MEPLKRPVWYRAILATVMLVCAAASAWAIHEQAGTYYPRGIGSWVDLTVLHQPSVLAAMVLVSAVALISWVVRYRQLSSGTVAFVTIALLSITEHALGPEDLGVRHAKFLPGAVLFFYLLFYAAYRRERGSVREAHGTAAACGAIGATYFLAFLSKVVGGGLTWGQGGGLGLIIASQSGDGSSLLGALRGAVAIRPYLVDSLSIGTLIVEATALLFVFPRARRAVALTTTAMHLGIFVLVGFGYVFLWSPVVLSWAFSSTRTTGAP